MTEDDNVFTDDSRRSFMKKGALASLGAGLTAAGAGEAIAQEDDGGDEEDNLFVEDEALDGVMFEEAFIPGGLFIMVSPNIDARTEVLPEEVSEFLTDYNMRILRYIDPVTQTLPLFVKDDIIDVGQQGEKDAIPPYAARVGFVVDDQLVEDNGIFFQGTNIGELEVGQLDQVRPSIFVLDNESNTVGENENVVQVNFSPIREEDEEGVFEDNETQIFGGAEPFGEEEGPEIGTETETGG